MLSQSWGIVKRVLALAGRMVLKVDVIDAASGQWSKPPVFASGAGGLASTVDDYCSFARMLLARGMHEKTRLLSETSADNDDKELPNATPTGNGESYFGREDGMGIWNVGAG